MNTSESTINPLLPIDLEVSSLESEDIQEEFAVSTWLNTEERKELLTKSNFKALSLFVPILSGYLICLSGTLLNLGMIPNLFFSFVGGIVLAQLFIIAHESIHNSFAEKSWQNRLIGNICFFLTLHSRILYQIVHVNFHHRFINVKGLDPNWSPYTKEEFDGLGLVFKVAYRIYRSFLGSFPYYLFDLWLKCYFLPIHPIIRADWRKYISSSIAVFLAIFGQIYVISNLGYLINPSRSSLDSVIFAWLIPICVCFWFISFTFYMQHINPAIPWFQKQSKYEFDQMSITCCNRVHFPQPIETMYIDIAEHTAHHLLAGIPLYNLKKAQRLFEQRYPNRTIVIPNGFMEFFRVTRICKLYDFDRNCWTDFDGNPTAPHIPKFRDAKMAEVLAKEI